MAETGLPEAFLIDLMLKFLFVGTSETTADLSGALRLPPGLVTELLEAATRGAAGGRARFHWRRPTWHAF